MIMEKIGYANVKNYSNNDEPILESISISYMSPAKEDSFSFCINRIYFDSNSVSMIVRLTNNDHTAISEGILLWKSGLFIRSKY